MAQPVTLYIDASLDEFANWLQKQTKRRQRSFDAGDGKSVWVGAVHHWIDTRPDSKLLSVMASVETIGPDDDKAVIDLLTFRAISFYLVPRSADRCQVTADYDLEIVRPYFLDLLAEIAKAYPEAAPAVIDDALTAPAVADGSLTPEKEARLRELWANDDRTVEEIGHELGFSEDNLRKRVAKRLGLPPRKRGRKPGR
jgi:hypothetical protein